MGKGRDKRRESRGRSLRRSDLGDGLSEFLAQHSPDPSKERTPRKEFAWRARGLNVSMSFSHSRAEITANGEPVFSGVTVAVPTDGESFETAIAAGAGVALSSGQEPGES